MVKVSVIIPTFNNTKENLNRLVASFDEQTMDQNEFEVIFVDDGSSEFQSLIRLKQIAESRSNYTVRGINPSGWGSKPRNYGTRIAKGKYVFYSDDDDSIFPQALEKMFDFAEENNLDVVNPKVIRTKGWSWGWNEYMENVINAEERGIQSMGPMTVPKLYRKSFLEENGLAFSEGEKVWWEDVMFSCLVYSKKPRIGILADYPVYHWREQNRSASFGKDLDYKWSQLNNLGSFFEKNLIQSDRDIMIGHWYKSRVLGAISKNFHKKSENDQKKEFEMARSWQQRFVNENVVSEMNTSEKILDYILREDRLDLALSLAKSKIDITARSYLSELSFVEDKIQVKCKASLTVGEKENLKLKGNSNEIKVNLPKDVAKALPADLLVYSKKEVDNSIYLPAIKGRDTRATWDIKTVVDSSFKYSKGLTGFNVKGYLDFLVDPATYALDDGDRYQAWDIATRFSFLDNFSQRAIACKDDFRKAAIINGETYVAYKNNSDLLSIDMNSTILDFLAVAKPEIQSVEVVGNSINIPISNVYVYGDSKITYFATVQNKNSKGFVDGTATISTKGNTALLTVSVPDLQRGENKINIALNNRAHEMTIQI
ncbi:glycosyltransferase family 2 protein [Edaphobacillus lindanitolerans]|uniref:Glycosyl transferase family 2 n=1 Tax=Edaphobacillus lindanitolerans TaxID=550447 RepID=A0A1U7PMW4_9BACI|nr:glycosyltransferase family 2 protein [Edaphobacillus lindanitolerans]SIT70982.1 Glycosyl transferase family 2 [Edaphobacillus lindanitolerans]